MKSAAIRIANYTARMQSSLLDPVLAAVNAKAALNFTAYAIDFVSKQLQLRVILSALSISTMMFGRYEAFHGEVYHLSKVATGPAAITTAQALVNKYIDAGCVEATLIKIAADIYGIIVPLSSP